MHSGGFKNYRTDPLTFQLCPVVEPVGEHVHISDAQPAGHAAGAHHPELPKLNREQLFAWEAPWPPLAEQKTIAGRIHAEFDQAESLREQLAQKLVAVEKLPATLLREAFNGRV